MRIYKFASSQPDQGMCISWHPSKDEAQKALREVQTERGQKYPTDEVQAVDLPTDKAGLLSWLNKNLTRDNG